MPEKKGNWVFIKMGSGRKQLKILAATSMTIFSLLTCFMGAYAWFNNKRTYDNGSDSMEIALLKDVVTKVSFHAQVGTKAVTEEGVTTNYYLFEKDEYASVSIANNIAGNLVFNQNSGAYKDWAAKPEAERTSTLSTYSLLAQDHPILILFDLIPYTADDGREVVIDFTTDNSYLGFANSINQSGNPLSSIVEFHSFGLTAALPSGGSYSSATQSYSDTYLYGAERNINYDKKWVTINNQASATFDSDGEITVFSNLDNNGTPSSTVYTQIGVVMNYNISSLEYIYNKFLGNPVLENNLYFSWDWTMEM